MDPGRGSAAGWRSAMSFLLGCAIWSYPGWVGELFPKGSRSQDFLKLYSRRLHAVEGNTTFYAIPGEETVARWAEETPEGFEFCPKLPRELTHNGALSPYIDGALAFLERMQGLGSRLGPHFLQLPPGYAPDRRADLTELLHAWPGAAPLAVVVRHPAWFREPQGPRLDALLEARGVGRVILDTRPIYSGPDDPQVLSERKKPKVPLVTAVTAPFAFVRYISHPDPERNEAFLAEWAARVEGWLRAGTRVYFFVHCPVEERSPSVARRFQALLEERGAPVGPLPWNLIKEEPKQLKLL
jgi:uncharacterized protein YecE (DUF72 family)